MSSLGQNYKIGPLYCLENSNDLTHPNPGLITNLMNCHECTRNKTLCGKFNQPGTVFSVLYSIKNTHLKVRKGRLRAVLLFPCRVSPECLFDAPIVCDILPLGVEAIQVDPNLPHSEVTVLV